jgi:hypothetical protein
VFKAVSFRIIERITPTWSQGWRTSATVPLQPSGQQTESVGSVRLQDIGSGDPQNLVQVLTDPNEIQLRLLTLWYFESIWRDLIGEVATDPERILQRLVQVPSLICSDSCFNICFTERWQGCHVPFIFSNPAYEQKVMFSWSHGWVDTSTDFNSSRLTVTIERAPWSSAMDSERSCSRCYKSLWEANGWILFKVVVLIGMSHEWSGFGLPTSSIITCLYLKLEYLISREILISSDFNSFELAMDSSREFVNVLNS